MEEACHKILVTSNSSPKDAADEKETIIIVDNDHVLEAITCCLEVQNIIPKDVKSFKVLLFGKCLFLLFFLLRLNYSIDMLTLFTVVVRSLIKNCYSK